MELTTDSWLEVFHAVSDGATFKACRLVCKEWRRVMDYAQPNGPAAYANNLEMVVRLSGSPDVRILASGRPGRGNDKVDWRKGVFRWYRLKGKVSVDYMQKMGPIDMYAVTSLNTLFPQQICKNTTIYNKGFKYDPQVWRHFDPDTVDFTCILEAAKYVYESQWKFIASHTVNEEYVGMLRGLDADDLEILMETPGFKYKFFASWPDLFTKVDKHKWVEKLSRGILPVTDEEWVDFYSVAGRVAEDKGILAQMPPSAVELLYYSGVNVGELIKRGINPAAIPWDVEKESCSDYLHLCPSMYGEIPGYITPQWCARWDMDWVWFKRIVDFLPEAMRAEYAFEYIRVEHKYK